AVALLDQARDVPHDRGALHAEGVISFYTRVLSVLESDIPTAILGQSRVRQWSATDAEQPPLEAAESEKLDEREVAILDTLLALGAEGKNRSKRRKDVAKRAEPACKTSTCNSAFSALAKKGYIHTCRGRGVWLTLKGVKLAKKRQQQGGDGAR